MKKNENMETAQDEVAINPAAAKETVEEPIAEGLEVEAQEPLKKTVKSKKMSLDDRITEWKKQYGRLYKTEIDGDTYIWRRLNRKEYVNLVTADDTSENKDIAHYDRQDQLCKITVLYPDNIEQIIRDVAGVASILSDEIMFKSGFSDLIPQTKEI